MSKLYISRKGKTYNGVKEKLRKRFFATGIGSVPHQDAAAAVEEILKNFPEMPFWPQLIKRSFFENMYAQFIEGFPEAIVDSEKKIVYLDTSKDITKKLEEVYQKIIDNDVEYFSITKNRAEGLYGLLDRLKSNRPDELEFIKGQVTGPISFGLTVTDQNKKAILYNPELRDLLTRVLVLKVKWQITKIKEVFDNIIIFIDEPYLVSIGSSHVNIKREDAAEKIRDLVLDAVHFEGALAGVHCCGNTDWSLLLSPAINIDILSFDAYNFMESVSLYPRQLKEFLERGGILAWGIVPTSKAIAEENAQGLVKRFEDGLKLLQGKGVSKDELLSSAMITPSCGCATLDIGEAERVFDLTREVSKLLRKKYS